MTKQICLLATAQHLLTLVREHPDWKGRGATGAAWRGFGWNEGKHLLEEVGKKRFGLDQCNFCITEEFGSSFLLFWIFFFPSPRLWNFPIYGKHRSLLRFSGQQEICDHLRWNHCDFSLVLFAMHATSRECITCTLELKDEVQGMVLDLSACNSD